MEVAGIGCLEFALEELRYATRGFDKSFKLGEGGFGPVYKGKLKFTEVAIKILRNTPKVLAIKSIFESIFEQ